ncbi:MAG: sulfatase-like hydrolase/transferase [Paracoccaceae bacterium]
MAQKNKKILFIVIDQLRADCLNGALAGHVDLPNLRALQDDAVSFLNHYTVTNPCGPARASLLTGQYAMNHRVVRNGVPLTRGTPNIAMESRKAGYDPLLFGYTDTAVDPKERHPKDPDLGSEETVMEGFREQVEMRYMESMPWRANLKSKGYDLPPYVDFYNPVPATPGTTARPDDPAFYKAEDSDTAFLADRFLRDMAVRTDQKWFAHLTYIRPHPPLVAPAPYNKMYNPDDLPAPAAAGYVHPFTVLSNTIQPIEKMVRGCGEISVEETQLLRAIYLGLATEVDHHIGRIISFLKETEQYDETLIIITADHGEMLGDHGLWAKQHLFDPAYKVSLIIRDPDHTAQHGTKIAKLTESIDIAPTILDWMGLRTPRTMNGASLKPFLLGTCPKKWRKYVHMELDFVAVGKKTLANKGIRSKQANLAIVHDTKFKLVHFNAVFAPLLYDLEHDPDEQVNLAKDPAHADTLMRLTQEMLSHRMRNLDQTMSGMPQRVKR